MKNTKLLVSAKVVHLVPSFLKEVCYQS